ncbi:hypothetical protein VTO42DRAFT_2101 [Malbranchea cinnamomea]
MMSRTMLLSILVVVAALVLSTTGSSINADALEASPEKPPKWCYKKEAKCTGAGQCCEPYDCMEVPESKEYGRCRPLVGEPPFFFTSSPTLPPYALVAVVSAVETKSIVVEREP